jgi:hypothetical protein
MRRSLLVLAAVSAAVPAIGCGSGVGPAAPAGATGPTDARYPQQGVSFRTPSGWSLEGGAAPLVATVRTGQATVAIWRFPRSRRLPRTPAELDAARLAILAQARLRDPTFQEIKSAATTIAGEPAVQIRARGILAGRRQVVRATHIYHQGAEVIIQAYADPDSFRGTDAAVFRPLLRSLRLTAARGGP